MKKFVCAMMFALMFCTLAFSVQPVKADTLDERVGALAVDTALSSFVDVLPSPEQVDALGGVQSWLGLIGQQFKEAWERDNRNWQDFLDSADTLIDDTFNAVIEVPSTVLDNVRDVISNFLDLIFGVENSGNSFETDNASLSSAIANNNTLYASYPNRNYCIIIGDGTQSGKKKEFIGDWSSGNNEIIYHTYEYPNRIYLNDASSTAIYVDASSGLTVLYWGSVPNFYRNSALVETFTHISVNLVDMTAPSEGFSFLPSVNNQFFNKYYFGFNSPIVPSNIVMKYETIYEKVSVGNYTGASGEIKAEKKGFWQKIKDALGNVHISIGGFGGVDIDFPDTDSFDSLYGDTDTSSVMSVENSSWLSFFSVLPTELITMLVMAVAVGCVCIIIKAVR